MRRAALILATLVAMLSIGVRSSGATFVASSANPGAGFATAADFNTVTVSVTDPGGALRGTVTLSATAASDRGIASVRLQSSPAGANTWTDVCTDTAAPYSCPFDTTTVADGLRDIRALALDSAGYAGTAVVASRRIDNTAPATTLTDPGTPLTGAKSLSASASDGGAGLASVTLQSRPAGSASWTDVCQRTSSPATCSLNTSTLPDGLYDLRSLAADAAGNTSSSVITGRRVDNTAPTVTLVDPGSAVRGTIALQTTSGDGAGSGVTSVRYQFRPASTGTWIDACTATTAPYSCTTATTDLPDGIYDARAIATDGTGLTTTSAMLTGRIDNTPARRCQARSPSPAARPTPARASPRCASRPRPRAPRAGPPPAATPARPTAAPGTRPRSQMASMTCAPSPPTRPATHVPRR